MDKIMLLVPIVFGLMLMVNIFTEVLKNLFTKIPTNMLVFILSIIITIVALFIYIEIASIAFVWWMICFAIAVAFFVAYAAMFGFDKWREMFDQWNQINSK